MSRKEFISVIVLSSLISAALVLVVTQWPQPPAVKAEFNPPSPIFNRKQPHSRRRNQYQYL